MKRILIIAMALVCIFISGKLLSNASGAIKATSAPGEGTCAQCHGNTPNSDANGSASISISGNPTSLTAGQSYTINVTSTYTGRNKFGFALSAKNSSNTDIGSFSSEGSTSLQVLGDYVTHTSSGTSGSANSKTWSFKWTAPASGASSVTFYASVMAANNNATDDIGDRIYTRQLSFTINPAAGISSLSEQRSFSVYPNPIAGSFHLSLDVHSAGELRVELMDLQGKVLETVLKRKVPGGVFKEELFLPNHYETGTYLLQIHTEEGIFLRKVFMQ